MKILGEAAVQRIVEHIRNNQTQIIVGNVDGNDRGELGDVMEFAMPDNFSPFKPYTMVVYVKSDGKTINVLTAAAHVGRDLEGTFTVDSCVIMKSGTELKYSNPDDAAEGLLYRQFPSAQPQKYVHYMCPELQDGDEYVETLNDPVVNFDEMIYENSISLLVESTREVDGNIVMTVRSLYTKTHEQYYSDGNIIGTITFEDGYIMRYRLIPHSSGGHSLLTDITITKTASTVNYEEITADEIATMFE